MSGGEIYGNSKNVLWGLSGTFVPGGMPGRKLSDESFPMKMAWNVQREFPVRFRLGIFRREYVWGLVNTQRETYRFGRFYH